MCGVVVAGAVSLSACANANELAVGRYIYQNSVMKVTITITGKDAFSLHAINNDKPYVASWETPPENYGETFEDTVYGFYTKRSDHRFIFKFKNIERFGYADTGAESNCVDVSASWDGKKICFIASTEFSTKLIRRVCGSIVNENQFMYQGPFPGDFIYQGKGK